GYTMKKTIIIIIAYSVLLAINKKQHIQPVDDPKDTPIFQQRLKSSLDRFQEDGVPARQDKMQARREPSSKIPPSTRPPAMTKDLVVAGRCGSVTLTWVEEKKIEKETISIKRRTQGEEYSLLKGRRTYEREEEGGGIRYWASDRELTDGQKYEYLISFKDPQGKEVTKKPVSITLNCTEKDREILAQREKSLKEYYQKKGVKPEDYAARRTSPASTLPPRSRELMVSGRCGRLNLTWVEEKKIEKETISGIRYWASDSGLTDGVKYEYLASFKDAKGKEMVKGPVSINLTCNERDREILAQREKMIKEYYQKRGIKPENLDASKPPSYQLSKETYQIDLGNSPHKGKTDAPVTLVVFTDFECLYCSTWAETLDTMLKTFPKEVKVVFKNYTIPYHKQAELAAVAALSAGEQGEFWEMHDLLFKNQKRLGKEDILGYAKGLGLNLTKFKKSLESKALKAIIDQDKAQGKTLGVRNIPTTFINGRSLMGSPPVSYIKGVIEDILKK
ncbi:MAG: thioredoxin domain-containing protein, partial [Deltaproteobacteria bacterium]|nr:thioredoxin domain-containing protein [Deltaproteobacteria bacterium]